MRGFFGRLFGREREPLGAEAPRDVPPDRPAATETTQAPELQTVVRSEAPRQMPNLLRGRTPAPEPPRTMPNLVAGSKEYSTVGLVYRDAEGDRTERIVTITAIVRDGARRDIFGYCHLRRRFRQFRADRIEGFFDPETGETFDTAHLKVHDGPVPAFPQLRR